MMPPENNKNTVADVVRKYDTEFRRLLRQMTRELNAAIEHDPICSLKLSLNTETGANKGAGGRITHITLIDASISMDITYG